jgi:alpha-1,3-rhamnosyl/mannosyltransferase
MPLAATAEERHGMRVIVNELQMLKQKTGIGHYTAELLRRMTPLAGADQIDGFPTGWLRPVTTACFRANQNLNGAGESTKAARGQLARLRSHTLGMLRSGFQAYLDCRFQHACAAGRYDLYHEPNYLPMPADCPTLATVHDLSVILHPEWHPADRVKRFKKQFPHVLSRCAHFLADTESVRRELITYCGVAPERITRVYMGIREDLRPLPRSEVERGLARLKLPRRYLLCLGTVEPRKNILRLLKVYCSLPERLRSAWPLLLVGGWGWNAGSVRDYLQASARHCGVLHLGYAASADLPILYNGARALLFPSYYEGFGLPPLEMMACGGAVIASTAAAVGEVVGDQAHVIDPEDSDGWRGAIERIVTDNDWWQSLRSGGEAKARPFTWERCALETLRVYRKICAAPSQGPVVPAVRKLAG